MELNFSTLDKWVPYKLLEDGEEVLVEWLYAGDEQFRESFFEQTLGRCKSLPENRAQQKNITTIVQMLEWAKRVNVQQPAAIVFHISRCGSTIVSQAFANNINNIVLSEVPFFDDVLQSPLKQAYGQGVLLKAVIKLYSLPRNGYGSKVFIKTDSWHIMFYNELRQVYPDVPFILLYRNPVEVAASLNKRPGRHCIPQFIKPDFFGIPDQVVTADDFYAYPIKVVEKYLEGFVEIAGNDTNAWLFNYNEGMPKVVDDIYKTIGIPFGENDREQMQQRLRYHSKFSGMPFSAEPTPQNTDEKFLHVNELYSRLEVLRISANNRAATSS